ncbi:MAG: hypothetical protein J7M19_02235 [Planctomycetes bacterium]|nr:hypothetical protein [Planctomycetota bacterium]
MSGRRILAVIVLFILAAVALIALNRISFLSPPEGAARTPAADVPDARQFTAESFDPDTGARRALLVAQSYTTLDDGSIDARDVSVDLVGTDVGDVTLSCERAAGQLRRIGKQFAGKVELTGHIAFNSVKDDKPYLAGNFEDISFDSGTKDVAADGPFVVSIADGMRLSGTGLSGNSERMHFCVLKTVRVEVPLEGPLFGRAADRKGKAALAVVEAGGPAVFDAQERTIVFSGGVKVTSGELRLAGRQMTLQFAAGPSKEALLPGGWEIVGIEVEGNVEAETKDFAVAGERLYWHRDTLTAGVKGAPARFSAGPSFIESPSVKVHFGNDGRVTGIDAVGKGAAYLAEKEAAEEASAVPPAAEADKGLAVRWRDSLSWDAAEARVVLRGDVKITAEDYRAAASRITVRLEKKALEDVTQPKAPAQSEGSGQLFGSIAGDVTGFDATDNVSFSDKTVSVTGDYASYVRATDKATLSGSPATAVVEGAEILARVFTFDRTKQILVAERECRVEISSPDQGKTPQDQSPPIHVKAGKIEAALSDDTLETVCTGNVGVVWDDNALFCDTLNIAGAGIADDQSGDIATGRVMVTGSGDVRFTSEQLQLGARCERFEFDKALDTLLLEPGDDDQVEIEWGDDSEEGDYARIWSDGVALDRKSGTVACEKPHVVLFTGSSFMGFLESDRRKDDAAKRRAKTKIDITTGNEMVFKRLRAEAGVLKFSGGVEAAVWDPHNLRGDKLTCGELELDVSIKSPKDSDIRPAGSLQGVKTQIVAARAKDGVFIKYAGPDETLEARGDFFEWERESRSARLVGSKAVAWMGGVEASGVQKADEFIYRFSDRAVEVIGAGAGTLTLNRVQDK